MRRNQNPEDSEEPLKQSEPIEPKEPALLYLGDTEEPETPSYPIVYVYLSKTAEQQNITKVSSGGPEGINHLSKYPLLICMFLYIILLV